MLCIEFIDQVADQEMQTGSFIIRIRILRHGTAHALFLRTPNFRQRGNVANHPELFVITALSLNIGASRNI
jgi:hypothetical protein